jgi:sialic acid synthase SpsE
MSVFLIAEAASAHDGDYIRATDLIELADYAGFDCAKFQWYSDADKLADRRGVPDYYREIYHRYSFPASWLPSLKGECERRGLEFMCTVYLPEDIPVVAPYVSRWKVASFEAKDRELLDCLPRDARWIVSTGMWDEDEVIGIRRLIGRKGHPFALDFLHCVSAYPCPVENANLMATSPLHTGYSDHTAHPLTGAVAVGAGAQIIEAHIRLNDTDPGNPDYACALDPGSP